MIGAGPGGLVAARWLLSQGFEPTIFEQSQTLGGQWTGLDGISGVWPAMHTNTSRILTSFSDLEHESDLVFPSNRDILDYLHRYAETFGLTSRIRFGTRVDLLSRGDERLAGRALRHDESLRTSGGGQRQISVALPSQRFPDSTPSPARRESISTYRLPGAGALPAGSAFWSRAVRSAPSRSLLNSPNSARHASW